ncbi:MAG: thio(seleno)oxazole modification radical SAM maturase SbtM [Desulfobacteraceae bacterium]|jgi:selenobiotic family peptide radical SAM maturase
MTYLLARDEKKESTVTASSKDIIERVFPMCRSMLDSSTWEGMLEACEGKPQPESFPKTLALHLGDLGLPDFLPELARLELTFHAVTAKVVDTPPEFSELIVNPTLQLLQLSFKNLASIPCPGGKKRRLKPEPGEEWVLLWRDPQTGMGKMQPATDEDLLVLKMVVEGIDAEETATTGGVPVGAVDSAMDRAIFRGILLAPPSLIRRDPESFPAEASLDEHFLTTTVFTLQWHITNACDLHCKHCYDRTKRSPLKLKHAIEILHDLRAFCRDRHVAGQVSFTGGNPLLYPEFLDLYRAASETGFTIAILGNPAPRERIEELLAIQRPVFYQVSLEGLKEQNDLIRGVGHFDRVIEFLSVLRDLNVYAMVMLTLTKDNIDQVIPLAEILRDKADNFTFNRLSMVGEGANLRLPGRDEYAAFLESYVAAAESNPIIGLKDNLINVLRYHNGTELFGGCTGYGCGAAFNFLALLPDGEVHGCRKFPSLIGNVYEQSLSSIYDSELARRYRRGSSACRSCTIRPVCGGCLASAFSSGLDIFEERDPYCFIDSELRT